MSNVPARLFWFWAASKWARLARTSGLVDYCKAGARLSLHIAHVHASRSKDVPKRLARVAALTSAARGGAA